MSQELRNYLQALERKHISHEVRSSPDELDKILADEFWEIGSSGVIFTKKECIEDGVVLTEMNIHNYEIKQLGEGVVLATYLIKDKTRERNTLRSSIWKKINGEWQLYFHQGTITE